jgi:hypothetical protein
MKVLSSLTSAQLFLQAAAWLRQCKADIDA